MASSSSSGFSQKKHDVFLSFRGEDTRLSFTSHLRAALRRKKIIGVFVDDEKLEKGDEISPALLAAIAGSAVCVVVLSENYASSTWCLDELAHMLSCKGRVLPIFYGVEPTHVRKQEGRFGRAFAALEARFWAGSERILRWRQALTAVASLKGWDSSVTTPEALLVEEIVEDVVKKLRNTVMGYVEHRGIVGIHKRVAKVESLLRINTPEVRFICIWGMGGIGKTNLARVVFDKLSPEFEGCCFVENVGEKMKNLGPKGLKNHVFSTLLEEKTSNMTLYRLRETKVLIVLDDLKSSQELRHLAGYDDWFGYGSRIIVTTRDKKLFKSYEIGDDQVYQVESLSSDEAFQLFSLNAFKRHSPTAYLIEISESVINYSKGNPLALNVLGSFFGGLREERWQDALDKLKILPNAEIQNLLKISFDGLDRMQMDIFLDIACFFEGYYRDHAELVLNACGFYASVGIDDLIDKSLVNVVDNKLTMHSLLQEMGREIIRQQCIDDPAERSRVWQGKDVYNILIDNAGTKNIEGMCLDMSEINRDLYLSPNVFQRMKKLRLLKIYNFDDEREFKVYLPENLRYLPNTLRYLHWERYPTKALPANFHAEFLVELIMPYSRLEELPSGVQNLTSLRKIDLSYSENLKEISSICAARNLEFVYLEYCGSLS